MILPTCLVCHKQWSDRCAFCNGKKAAWLNEYRIIDLNTKDNNDHSRVRDSFRDYNLSDERGALQYAGLPNLCYKQTKEPLKVGCTPLLKLSQLGRVLKTNVFIKSEGHNPSGCFKDRETLMCLLKARKGGFKKAVIYSSGNAAASAALFAQQYGFHLITFVSGDTYKEKISFIKSHGSDVIVIGDEHCNFEQGYRLFSSINSSGTYIQSGYDNWSVNNPVRVEGDKTTAIEIVKQLSEGHKKTVPDYIIVPTANGTCLAGIWKGFKELFHFNIIDKLPRMVSAGITNANPVYQAVQEKVFNKPVKCDINELKQEDAAMGSIIVAEEGYDSIAAAQAIKESKGEAVVVDSTDIKNMYASFLTHEGELAKREHILPEPASLISLAAIEKVRDDIRSNDLIVSIITGSGFKAQKRIRALIQSQSPSLATAEEIIAYKDRHQPEHAEQKGREIAVNANLKAVASAFLKLKKTSQ